MRISDWSSDVCSSDLNRKRLPDRIIQPCVANLFQIDGIGLAENVAAFLTHFARNANSKPWPRKGMPTDKDVRQAQFPAQLKHRTEDRRVGKAWGSTCSPRWTPLH